MSSEFVGIELFFCFIDDFPGVWKAVTGQWACIIMSSLRLLLLFFYGWM